MKEIPEPVSAFLATPIGVLEIRGTPHGLQVVRFLDEPLAVLPDPDPQLLDAVVQLDEYFRGERRDFVLPLASTGTPFQQRVWAEVRRIPFGETRTYGTVADALGDRNAVRAVGAANGANPLAIVVPCHRVIGSDGDLTGYAGGLWRKEWLLAHEGRPTQARLF